MCDDDIHPGLTWDPTVSRRTFGLLGAVAVGMAGTGAMAQSTAMEMEVEVPTPDGRADAVLYHPAGEGPWPGVLIWTDIMSLRPAFRLIGRRLAEAGYTVLVPNVYYRVKRAPVVPDGFNYGAPGSRELIQSFQQGLDQAAWDRDTAAYMTFLDAQAQTDKTKKAGVQGYCMGGRLTFRTAKMFSDRIGAAGSFHGGGLATPNPDSPHLWIPEMQAELLVAVAQNDDQRDPTAKDTIKAAMEAAGRPGLVEVFAADHGWCVPGSAAYNEPEAERAWAALIELYKRRLV
ncbi:MAG: dienelactone hydrolase family protein [Brevundimonas sp.]|nr:MAG: dienelactone hydrolase family protein [Brevundimonas sp.]